MLKVEFGPDGIRDIAGHGLLTPLNIVHIGQALGQFVCRRSEHPIVVIGRDTRPTGRELLDCLIAGLTGQGIDVIDLGVMTTPGVAFLARLQQADLGVSVSASHNPLEYNGIKVIGPKGLRLQREEEIEIETLCAEFPARAAECADIPGEVIQGQHLIEVYIQDHILRCPVKSLAGLKVVLDCANGAAARVAPEVFRRLGASVTAINDAIDKMNINYRCGSEHARNHPEEIARMVQVHSAEYGFAFDGDGDRLTIVDARGQVFDGNDFLYMLAVYFNSKNMLRDYTIVTTELINGGLVETLEQMGIQTVFTSKGDKNLEAAMWGGDYSLGSEPGGNVIINDGHHTAADAVYAALVLGGVIVYNQPMNLAEIVAPLRKRPQAVLTLHLPITPILDEDMRETIRRTQSELGDGGRILYWSSATEPGAFRVMVEGGATCTQAKVASVAHAICEMIRMAVEQTNGMNSSAEL
jgi:phosphoglucosamine mutase